VAPEDPKTLQTRQRIKDLQALVSAAKKLKEETDKLCAELEARIRDSQVVLKRPRRERRRTNRR